MAELITDANPLNGTPGPDTLIYFKVDDPIGDNFLPSSYLEQVYINGFDGNDLISDVSFSYDIINGGAGNDTIYGYSNFDVIQGDDVDGVAGNDYLYGGEDTDGLFGVGGNDTLIGGTGKDTLDGGAGNDVFGFDSVSDSQPGLLRDIIQDFVGNGNLPGDRIDLSRIDANSTKGGDQAFTYIGTRTFSAAGQIRYSGGILQGNTDSNLSANFEIQLAGSPLLVASDIIA
ncbi:calcium-binding protein [Nostoc sp.]|uniref:calcium-binding protein n=1 Tax=Nostoc sp. TaxID=1180 RepID=UPI002FFC1F54